MSTNVEITGDKELGIMFRDFPENGYRKPVMAAFRKAAAPVNKAMKAAFPPHLKGLSKVIRTVAYKGDQPVLGVGVHGGRNKYVNRRGQAWNPWHLIYWHSYGTLANRSASHIFVKPRRQKTASRQGGIMPNDFLERAWNETSSKAEKLFEENYVIELEKYFEKHAAS